MKQYAIFLLTLCKHSKTLLTELARRAKESNSPSYKLCDAKVIANLSMPGAALCEYATDNIVTIQIMAGAIDVILHPKYFSVDTMNVIKGNTRVSTSESDKEEFAGFDEHRNAKAVYENIILVVTEDIQKDSYLYEEHFRKLSSSPKDNIETYSRHLLRLIYEFQAYGIQVDNRSSLQIIWGELGILGAIRR